MRIELNVNGYFDVIFYHFHPVQRQVSNEVAKTIVEKLITGEYIFSVVDKKVLTLDGFKHIYDGGIEATDSIEYDWEVLS